MSTARGGRVFARDPLGAIGAVIQARHRHQPECLPGANVAIALLAANANACDVPFIALWRIRGDCRKSERTLVLTKDDDAATD